ncbi:Nuclear envelope protein [Rasamsonia emersonii CBS 393.64]|uniref:Nuclear envelope protein n=1 Tax=Rasamsonia emersonii (strain ATCC 16479 / CBS 393.64 / IMI 116815) TaxID=1408163 RepID=A0A0F4Z1E4_RASE3|nr:Nuclear envelope protein [Rasamsonia emersonii CBS 393.64]KKA23921.1 Nuclear envelope protein [Rasamsonia emersonii CBS 393.64]
MAASKPRPYRRILTSALHRRFVHASALALLVDYVVSFAIGVKSSFFWSWFPIGICGLRALLLFVSSLSVFVLRVGQMHVGPRTTNSQFATFRHLFPLHIIQTLGWYLFSAWWFSEIYVWSAPQTADLGWVKPGRPNERTTLNERPIYLHCYHLLLAIMQAAIHLYSDCDRLDIPVAKRTREAEDQRTHPVDSVVKRIQQAVIKSVFDSFTRGVLMAVASPFIYMLFLRHTAWSYTLYFAKLFWNFPRAAAAPPGRIPSAIYSLFPKQVVSGACLVFLWQTSNVFFTVFIAQEPLKRGQPLTTETKDPTGSLINGLKARKELPALPGPTETIFSDIDRDGGPAWTQILNASVEIVKGITTRINEYKNPPSAVSKSTAEQPQLQTLPRLTEPPKQENIFAASPKGTSRHAKLGETISTTAKSYGQSPDWTPIARAKARDMLNQASNAVLSPERKQKLLGSSPEMKLLTGAQPSSAGPSIPFISPILRSPVGQLFRQTYDRRLRRIVLGGPHGELGPIVDAIESLTRLLVASLAEDPYGKVQADVPTVVRLFTDTIITLEDFVQGGLDVHWTDVTFPPSSDAAAQEQARRVPEVDIVLDTLKSSLSDLLAAFKPYLGEVGLKEKDLRLARAAAGIVDEDQEPSS